MAIHPRIPAEKKGVWIFTSIEDNRCRICISLPVTQFQSALLYGTGKPFIRSCHKSALQIIFCHLSFPVYGIQPAAVSSVVGGLQAAFHDFPRIPGFQIHLYYAEACLKIKVPLGCIIKLRDKLGGIRLIGRRTDLPGITDIKIFDIHIFICPFQICQHCRTAFRRKSNTRQICTSYIAGQVNLYIVYLFPGISLFFHFPYSQPFSGILNCNAYDSVCTFYHIKYFCMIRQLYFCLQIPSPGIRLFFLFFIRSIPKAACQAEKQCCKHHCQPAYFLSSSFHKHQPPSLY